MEALIVICVFAMIIAFAIFKQPRCPKCNSDDIGLFTFHGKKVFTCHECGHKDSEDNLKDE